MDKILSYIWFVNAEAFEQWQKENPDFDVCQVSPMVSGFEFNLKETEPHNTAAKAKTTNLRTFVLYKK